jgi:hypothetical protein
VSQKFEERLRDGDRAIIGVPEWDEVLSLTRADPQVEAPLAQVLEGQRRSGNVGRGPTRRIGHRDTHGQVCGGAERGADAERIEESVAVTLLRSVRRLLPDLRMLEAQEMVGDPK